MSNSNSSRLEQIEELLQQSTIVSNERMARIEQQREQDLAASRETKQLIQSNSRAIRAMLDAMTEDKLEREEFRQQIARLDDVVIRLTTVQEGGNNLLASLDSDRPTILRKLNSIETKVDRLLQDEE